MACHGIRVATALNLVYAAVQYKLQGVVMNCNIVLQASRRWRAGALAGLLACGLAHAADDLPALHAKPQSTSVSGLSSGAFMSVQYGTAYSASVMGVGVVAGGPYNCAYVNSGGIMACMSGSPSGQMSWLAAEGFATLGQIDPVAGIAKQKVYVFSGTQDAVVKPPVVQATRDFYQAAAVPKADLAYVNALPAGHAFIATTFGNVCATNATPYIDQCAQKGKAYDQPLAILQHIYGPLQPAVASLSSTVRPFDQRAFASADTGLDSVGFYYVPISCATNSSACAVHVVFHGCQQGAAVVGSDVYSKVGYNQWADSNQTIVLYPQILASQMSPQNPQGCWDWWGYSGANFQVKSGPQMMAVKAMVDRLTTTP